MKLALGHALKMIHVGANKMINNATVIESYYTSMETQKEQHQYFKLLNLEGIRNKTVALPKRVTVTLNNHDINAG